MWEAATQCQARFGTISSVDRIDNTGRIWYGCLGSCPEKQAFEACYAERLGQAYQAGAISASGHLSAESRAARRTEVPVHLYGNAVLVPVSLNGDHAATLLLDTGATMSLLNPELAKRIGAAPRPNAPTATLRIVGGQEITLPMVKLRSIRAGGLLVEDLEVGVYQAMPEKPDVDGLLGADFLRSFRVTVDRASKRLILEVQ